MSSTLLIVMAHEPYAYIAAEFVTVCYYMSMMTQLKCKLSPEPAVPNLTKYFV